MKVEAQQLGWASTFIHPLLDLGDASFNASQYVKSRHHCRSKYILVSIKAGAGNDSQTFPAFSITRFKQGMYSVLFLPF